MINKLMIALLGLLMVGCTNSRYPNWQYVRIESQPPSPNCIYKMQEPCSLRTNACLNWHKQRATTFGADTVVIINSESQKSFSAGIWTAKGGDNGSTLADYYYCSGQKNLKPPRD